MLQDNNDAGVSEKREMTIAVCLIFYSLIRSYVWHHDNTVSHCKYCIRLKKTALRNGMP